MADTWKAACWKAEQELAEYKSAIVPALVRQLRLAERERDAANRLVMELEREMEFTRKFIHDHGLEFALASVWAAEIRKKGGDSNG